MVKPHNEPAVGYWLNMLPLPLGTRDYAIHGPHYAAFGLLYTALRPLAL